eukprot:scaffold153469_cov32-Tisochrysis_lutea.AAC.1
MVIARARDSRRSSEPGMCERGRACRRPGCTDSITPADVPSGNLPFEISCSSVITPSRCENVQPLRRSACCTCGTDITRLSRASRSEAARRDAAMWDEGRRVVEKDL